MAPLRPFVSSCWAGRTIAILLMSLLTAYAIWQASIVIDGTRYFSLDDDQMVAMRYGRNLAEGFGPVWNPGERVEGYTGPAWMAVMALVHWLGACPGIAVGEADRLGARGRHPSHERAAPAEHTTRLVCACRVGPSGISGSLLRSAVLVGQRFRTTARIGSIRHFSRQTTPCSSVTLLLRSTASVPGRTLRSRGRRDDRHSDRAVGSG
jgi:hypothetical protein